MNNKNEAKKSGETSRKSKKTGLKQRSYDDKFKLKVLREMVCTGETLALLSKRHDLRFRNLRLIRILMCWEWKRAYLY